MKFNCKEYQRYFTLHNSIIFKCLCFKCSEAVINVGLIRVLLETWKRFMEYWSFVGVSEEKRQTKVYTNFILSFFG